MPRRMGARCERQPSRLEMKKLLLSGVAALSLMLVHNAYAGEDEVVCLTPDASKALCGVLVTPRDAEIANAPHKTVILHGSGGSLPDYLDRFREPLSPAMTSNCAADACQAAP